MGERPLRLPEALETALVALFGEKGLPEAMNMEPPPSPPTVIEAVQCPTLGQAASSSTGVPVDALVGSAPNPSAPSGALTLNEAACNTQSMTKLIDQPNSLGITSTGEQGESAPTLVTPLNPSNTGLPVSSPGAPATQKGIDGGSTPTKTKFKDPARSKQSTAQGIDKQNKNKTTKNKTNPSGDTDFDLYPAEPSEQAPWVEGPAGTLSSTKRLRSPTDHLSQTLVKHPSVAGWLAPASPPACSNAELELKWASWTKEGLVSVCKAQGIKLAVTNKLAIIQEVISKRVTFSLPPVEYKAVEIRATPPRQGSLTK